MPYTVPTLPYSFDALEPHIDAKTMEIHHDKHHQAYVDKLNAALPEETRDVETVIRNLESVPENVRTAVRNNGGGHFNHSFFWVSLSAQGGGEPTGTLAEKISENFESFENFKTQFADVAVARFGSGWAWLVQKADGSLTILSTPNQDTPIMDDGSVTLLLGLDVWEHAYYLTYQNRRPDYISAFWNVVDWNAVAARLK